MAVANVGDSRAVMAQWPEGRGESLPSPFSASPRPSFHQNAGAGAGTGAAESCGIHVLNPKDRTGCFLEAVALSVDHKVSVAEERRRVEAAGAM